MTFESDPFAWSPHQPAPPPDRPHLILDGRSGGGAGWCGSGSAELNLRDRIVARARGCVGAPFRPHGRRIEHGLDCVGVAGITFDRAVPADYALRGGRAEDIAATIAATGLVVIDPAHATAGDLLLAEAGLGQFHLLVLTERGHVHADVGLRRVVETPGSPAGRILGAWTEEG